MPATFNNTINVTTLSKALEAGNQVTGGVFWNATVILVFVGMFTNFKRWRTRDAVIGAGFISWLWAVLLYLINPTTRLVSELALVIPMLIVGFAALFPKE